MADTISILSEIRSSYNCFDEEEEPYYRALTKGIEAIKVAQQEIDYWRDKCKMYEQAVKMAYAELPDTNVGDIISRQAAIDVLDTGLWGVEWDKALATAMLKDLPSAERKGHWKNAYALTEYRYRCSECFANHRARYDYCPSCGARMERE